MLSGSRMPFSDMNLTVGAILPRAMPVRSLTMHSTSVMRCSLRKASILFMQSSWPGGSGPAGVSERLEYTQVEGVFRYPPFRMPLYAEGEGGGGANGKRFNESIGGHGFGLQSGGQTID